MTPKLWNRGRLLGAVFMLGVLGAAPSPSRAHSGGGSEIKVDGFVVDVPGSSLVLPLLAGSPAVPVSISFGVPPVMLTFMVTPATQVETEEGRLLPVTVVDGDRVKIEARLVSGVLQATKLELEDFPELKLLGTAAGLPDGGVSLPLASGEVTFSLVLGTATPVSVPVVVTPRTRIEDGAFVLTNGMTLEIEAVFREGRVVVTEIEREDD